MREIKSYSAAFLMSLAIHTLILIFLVIFTKASLDANKIVVIDLTLIDHVTADAGNSGNNKAGEAFEPKTNHQKVMIEEVPMVIEQQRDQEKEEKTETVEEVIQDNEHIDLVEQVPPIEAVQIVQESEQSPISEKNGAKESSGSFLAQAQTNGVKTLGEGGVPGTHGTQALGNGAGNTDGVMKGYLSSHLSYIKKLIQKNITYPDIARRNGWIGKVTVSFIIAHNGCVRDVKVVRSSSFSCLDNNAVKAVKRSSPFPHPPVEARIIIPILYELH